tara:strand:+ start:15953 stop:16813 length:861 start_codon:yes stop_codon:yes gene_type:complete
LTLDQVDGVDPSTNATEAEIIPGGAVDRAHVGIGSASPTVGLRTRDLVTFFGTVSATAGLAVAGASTFYFQRRDDGGTFKTGSSNHSYTSTNGFLRPTTITASQDDTDGAMLQSEFTPLWDGTTTEPLVHNASVDIDSEATPAFNSRFFLGPVYHNAAQLDGITSITVDYGINYVAEAFNGDAYAKTGAIVTRQPVFTFVTKDWAVGAALDMFGRTVTSSLAIYLQKGLAGGTREPAASTVHCKIGCTAGYWRLDEASVQGTEDGQQTFSVRPTGTITTVTNSAIP